MTKIKNCSQGVIAARVSVKADCIDIVGNSLLYKKPMGILVNRVVLPEGDWTILLDTSTVTEEDAAKVVEWYNDPDAGIILYKDYEQSGGWVVNAVWSFDSYKTFYGINEGRHILLIDKNFKG